ncbi:phosphotransferase [Schaalia vaccimaxillae]|uniref:phosphotransferase n=1 Tax=Schaalia vaccimaxillae TaxID=183916 RepID=UPI0003B4E222|nr:phosphotransferase [Schaalia vaccimaxillae]
MKSLASRSKREDASDWVCAWAQRSQDQGHLAEPLRRLVSDVPKGHANLPAGWSADFFDGHQSNRSVIVSIDEAPKWIIKRYAREAMDNPELEVLQTLQSQRWEHSPSVVGWTRTPKGALDTLATQWIDEANDGFATISSLARSGQDGTNVLAKLGAVTAQLHQILGERFPEGQALSASSLAKRIDRQLKQTQDVAQLSPAIVAGLKRHLNDLDHMAVAWPTQRIHADFHLGQTLLGQRWFILDFEGEPHSASSSPGKCDLVERDVAGMLRSIDYAATGDVESEWAYLARRSFLQGWNGGKELSSQDEKLLRCLEIEKALYEVEYELAYRPDWVEIPLRALEKLSR